jgi:8-oxo-dGTP diphosphatase
MELYLIRHAHAGDRHYDAHDRYRPLTEIGRAQAALLAVVLARRAITSILTSPATRCVQTVEPLAATLGLPIQECDELWEESSRDQALSRIHTELQGRRSDPSGSGVGGPGIVACSHGNLVPEMLETLADAGVKVMGRGCERGSIWLVTADGAGTWTEARYFTPRNRFGGL